MAALLTNFSRQTVAMNAGLDTTTTPNTAAPQIFSFMSTTDNAATVEAANYFAPFSYDLFPNDFIFCVCSDATVLLQVLTVDNTVVPALVTTELVGFSGSVATANIQDHAVTYVKMQQVAASSLLGNATGGLANVEEITLGNGLDFTGTTLEVAPALAQHARVALTAAQFNGMYATPVQLVAAPGAGKLVVVDKVLLNQTFVSAAYAAGGVVAPQYDSTVHGGGTLASSASIAAATIQGIVSNSIVGLTGLIAVTASAALINKGIFLSNATGAFTTGDGTWTVDIWYRTIAAA